MEFVGRIVHGKKLKKLKGRYRRQTNPAIYSVTTVFHDEEKCEHRQIYDQNRVTMGKTFVYIDSKNTKMDTVFKKCMEKKGMRVHKDNHRVTLEDKEIKVIIQFTHTGWQLFKQT